MHGSVDCYQLEKVRKFHDFISSVLGISYSTNEKFLKGRIHCEIFLSEYFFQPADLKACNFVKKRLQHRSFPVKFAKILRAPPVVAYEFCSGGCVRIVSVSKYIIISNQCIKVNV